MDTILKHLKAFTLAKNAYANTSHNLPNTRIVFRVSGIPLEWGKEKLEFYLSENTDDAYTIGSQAVEVDGKSQTATITFKKIPHQLEGGRAWPIPLADSGRDNGPRMLMIDSGFLGITTLYTPPPSNHKLDIIAISGLGGHAFGSFKERGGRHMWLRDALPYDITDEREDTPLARVMTYGYESSLQHSRSFQSLEDLATSFHASLLALLSNATTRPIIFIAHSLGGLILKQVIILMSKSKREEDQELLRAVCGILFFGVPHDGMDIGSLIAMVEDNPNRFLLESIGNMNPSISQHRDFSDALSTNGQCGIVCFYETLTSPTAKRVGDTWEMSGPNVCLVTKASATNCQPWVSGPEHVCAINRTHSEIVKFQHQDHDYKNVIQRMKSLIRQSLKTSTTLNTMSPYPLKLIQRCLQSLAFPGLGRRYLDIQHPTSGTCEWLLRHEQYKEWNTHGHNLLWIKGKPGSGKSVALKYALENMEPTQSTLVLSFFYHGRGGELERSPLGLIRSLLHQALVQCPEALSALLEAFKTKDEQLGEAGVNWNWALEELWGFFGTFIGKVLEARDACLIIDALDESGEAHAVDVTQRFKSLLTKARDSSSGNSLHILFSCRHYPSLNLDDAPEIHLERENYNDIKAFVTEQLAESEELASSNIPELITSRASGIFLWARLVVDRIMSLARSGHNQQKVEAEVHSTPQPLEEIYQNLLQKMDKASLKLMQWICFSTRPLSPDELPWAMVIEADGPDQTVQTCMDTEDFMNEAKLRRRIQALSCGLVEITSNLERSDPDVDESDMDERHEYSSEDSYLNMESSSDVNDHHARPGPSRVLNAPVVQFIHQSVRSFFVEGGLSAMQTTLRGNLIVGTAHFRLAAICIRALTMVDAKPETNFGFLDYAVNSWVRHMRECELNGAPSEDLLKLLRWPSNSLVEVWAYHFYKLNHKPPRTTTLLHVLASYGIVRPFEWILKEHKKASKYMDSTDSLGQTPLMLASKRGQDAIVKLLIATRKVRLDIQDNSGRTPLLRAATHGHATVISLLLATGKVKPNKTGTGRTPLASAAFWGHENVVELLMKTRRVKVDTVEPFGTPLTLASTNGHGAIVKMLLATKKVNINHQNMFGWSPLMLAAMHGHADIAKQLMKADNIRLDLKDIRGLTALEWAMDTGDQDVIRLLQ